MQITTRRFLLRDFVDADTTAFVAYHEDPRSREFYEEQQDTSQHARELIELFITWAAAQLRVNYQLAIVHSGSQELVGCCGLRTAGSEQGTAELGIELAPSYWGRYAYAIEVMRALARFGFDTLNLREIYGETVSANSRVARLVDSFGATSMTRATPAWMSARGWTQVEWRLTRARWVASQAQQTARRSRVRSS